MRRGNNKGDSEKKFKEETPANKQLSIKALSDISNKQNSPKQVLNTTVVDMFDSRGHRGRNISLY